MMSPGLSVARQVKGKGEHNFCNEQACSRAKAKTIDPPAGKVKGSAHSDSGLKIVPGPEDTTTRARETLSGAGEMAVCITQQTKAITNTLIGSPCAQKASFGGDD
jgi:hypothetical protein